MSLQRERLNIKLLYILKLEDLTKIVKIFKYFDIPLMECIFINTVIPFDLVCYLKPVFTYWFYHCHLSIDVNQVLNPLLLLSFSPSISINID